MKNEKMIDHEHTDEIVCPFCGYELGDSWDYDSNSEDLGLIECEECEKSFYGTRNIRVDYSTRKAKYGTCGNCENENVVIENYHSTLGNYKELCVKCGAVERSRLIRDYF